MIDVKILIVSGVLLGLTSILDWDAYRQHVEECRSNCERAYTTRHCKFVCDLIVRHPSGGASRATDSVVPGRRICP